MEIIRAKTAGFCFGVDRAVKLTYDLLAQGRKVATLGPLIHNAQVVADLEAKGAVTCPDIDAVPDGYEVIIRSHGVTPEVKRAVERRGLPMVDATCPHVARAQKAAAALAREGMQVIVVGEAGHPEVEGLYACACEASADPALVSVVAVPDDLPERIEAPVGVVVQTTQTRAALDAVLDALRERGVEPTVKDTICFATRQRQEAAAALADEADAFVVIGGRNSSNTTRLADICRVRCERTHHVESADELDPAWFEGCRTVGVTAGASTPEDQIAAVEAALAKL